MVLLGSLNTNDKSRTGGNGGYGGGAVGGNGVCSWSSSISPGEGINASGSNSYVGSSFSGAGGRCSGSENGQNGNSSTLNGGSGGISSKASTEQGTGGGGGGLVGGGGVLWRSGGGGGSGYVNTSKLISAKTIAGNQTFPNVAGTGNETGHSGNGVAKITPVN